MTLKMKREVLARFVSAIDEHPNDCRFRSTDIWGYSPMREVAYTSTAMGKYVWNEMEIPGCNATVGFGFSVVLTFWDINGVNFGWFVGYKFKRKLKRLMKGRKRADEQNKLRMSLCNKGG